MQAKEQSFDESANLNFILSANPQINPQHGNLFLGGIQFYLKEGKYNPNKFTSIVSVLDAKLMQEYDVQKKVESLDISKEDYRHFDLDSMSDQQVLKSLNEVADFIEEKLKKGNVLVHCKAGVSKSSTMLISYIVKYRKIPLQEAIGLVKSKRAKANPNAKYTQLLKQFEKSLV